MQRDILGTVVLLSLLVPSTAALGAQGDGRIIEEVVVTASKREQSLMDVPQAVQAISGAELDANGIDELSDLVNFVPGASVVSSSAPGFETIQMRGIASGTTGDATVGYYIDDVAFSVPNLQLAPPTRMFDLERVEVLRGPQGTLYGQGSMGGTIKLITSRPDSREFSLRSRLEASSVQGGDSGYNLDVTSNIPVIEDRLAVTVTGGYEELPGWIDSPEIGEDDINEAELWNVRVKGLYTPNENLDVTATFWTIDNQLEGANSFSRLNPETGEEFDEPTMAGIGGNPGFIDSKLDMYSLLLDWQAPFANVVSASSYTDHELDFVFPLFTAGLQFFNDSTFETDAFTQEIRFLSHEDSAVKWIVGGYYRDATIDSRIDFFIDFGAGVTVPLINTFGQIETESWALFGEVSVELFDGLVEPLIGLRYFEDDRHTDDGFDFATMEPRPSVGTTYETVNPRFALKIRPADNGMVYVNAAKGFRSGTTQTQDQADLANLIGVPTSTTIDTDEVWTYDLGTKWTLLDGALTVDTAVYYSDWQDIQLQFTVPGTIALANGGDAEIIGLDLALQWLTPIDGLSLQFSGNINDSEFKDVNPALAEATVTVGEGEPLPNVPEQNATLGLNYVRSIGQGLEGFLNANYSYRDSQIDAGSGLESGVLQIADVRLGVRNDRWEVTVFGENILDEEEPVVRTSTGVQFLTPPRVGVQLSWQL